MSESDKKSESELPTEIVTSVENKKSELVKLNVGGYLYQTTVDTLTKFDCMFKGMFSGGFKVQKDSEGNISISYQHILFWKIFKSQSSLNRLDIY